MVHILVSRPFTAQTDVFGNRSVEKAGILHAGIGKVSFTEQALLENIKAFADAVQKSKPAGAKGTYMKRVALSSTMGPGVHVDPSTVH